LIEGLEKIEGAHVNGLTGNASAPQIVSCSFENIRSEVLLHALEDQGIYVSSGSACGSSHPAEINTLLSIGLDRASQEGTIRFSFNIENTMEEVDEVLTALQSILPMLRRFTRR